MVKPVLDLNAAARTDAYAIPDRIREQVVLRDSTCDFPRCTRDARRCDLEEVPWHDGGETTPADLAPLCRRHHRLETFGGWQLATAGPGSFTWTTPHGEQHRTGRRRP